MRLKTSKKKKVSTITNSTISKQKQKKATFYAPKKHLRRKKYISKRKQKTQHSYALKKRLKGRK